jgi:hypothetical protein
MPQHFRVAFFMKTKQQPTDTILGKMGIDRRSVEMLLLNGGFNSTAEVMTKKFDFDWEAT